MGFSHAHMIFLTSALHIDAVTYQPWSPTGHCQSQYMAMLNDMIYCLKIIIYIVHFNHF